MAVLGGLEGEAAALRQDLLERAAEAAEAERLIGDMRNRLMNDTPRLADLVVLEDKVRMDTGSGAAGLSFQCSFASLSDEDISS